MDHVTSPGQTSEPVILPFTLYLSHAFILRQVPMGHEEAIVLIFILPDLIVIILKEKK